jgi:integral membrane protein (TIGR01906 family)
MKMRILSLLAGFLFIICIPLLLVTSSARIALNTPQLYEYGWNKYESSVASGLSISELHEVNQGVIDYFNTNQELEVADYFKDREVQHLADVRGILRIGFRIQEASLIYAIIYIFFGYILLRRKWWPIVSKRLIWGSGLTLAIIAASGIALAIDFDGIFTWFHEVSFSNYLWLALPSDMMTRIYPEDFFFDAAIFIVIATIVECIIIGGLSSWYLRWRHKRSVATVATGGGTGTTSA